MLVPKVSRITPIITASTARPPSLSDGTHVQRTVPSITDAPAVGGHVGALPPVVPACVAM